MPDGSGEIYTQSVSSPQVYVPIHTVFRGRKRVKREVNEKFVSSPAQLIKCHMNVEGLEPMLVYS